LKIELQKLKQIIGCLKIQENQIKSIKFSKPKLNAKAVTKSTQETLLNIKKFIKDSISILQYGSLQGLHQQKYMNIPFSEVPDIPLTIKSWVFPT